MRRVGEKMRSRKGASMLFALLVFMLCILAGTAALTAAAANSGRYTHMEAEQQDYLSVASAARVVRDEIVDAKFTAGFKVSVEDKAGTKSMSSQDSTSASFVDSSSVTSVFDGIFTDYFTYLYKEHAETGIINETTPNVLGAFETAFTSGTYPPSPPATDPELKSSTLKVSGIAGMSEVTLEFKVDNNFNITATLYTGSDADHKRNETVVELKAEVEYTDSEESETFYYVDTTVGGGSPAYKAGTRTTAVRNIMVTWTDTNATIKDGGAVS